VEIYYAIALEFMNHFQATLTKIVLDKMPTIRKIIDHIPKLVTREQNDLLLMEISMQEVEATVG